MEFIFAATEEAIFVHVIVSAKFVKAHSSIYFSDPGLQNLHYVCQTFFSLHSCQIDISDLFISRHIRALSSSDIERVSRHSSNNSSFRLPGSCAFLFIYEFLFVNNLYAYSVLNTPFHLPLHLVLFMHFF